MHGYSPDGTLNGYVNFTLSTIKTSDLDNKTMTMLPLNKTFYDTCHYTGHYNPPDSEDPYDFSPAFWHINFFRKIKFFNIVFIIIFNLFRLLFVVLFQTLVSLAQLLANVLVPDVPGSLVDKIG